MWRMGALGHAHNDTWHQGLDIEIRYKHTTELVILYLKTGQLIYGLALLCLKVSTHQY